ncbi:hypothetical protein Hypma_007344 [Hypsizygus marmoreus]|uniref:Uncharacterized protein n=1 Tax=Hypsizygus marmoreus TaxID=39966 RepID=A0A369JWF7_HYPMA|nr:hypothetical protein Hypma_007344 [Hypsizygus marmoreus]
MASGPGNAQPLRRLPAVYPCKIDYPLYIVAAAPDNRTPSFWEELKEYVSLRDEVGKLENKLMWKQKQQKSIMVKTRTEEEAERRKGVPVHQIPMREVEGMDPLGLREDEHRYVTARYRMVNLETSLLTYELDAAKRRVVAEQEYLNAVADSAPAPAPTSADENKIDTLTHNDTYDTNKEPPPMGYPPSNPFLFVHVAGPSYFKAHAENPLPPSHPQAPFMEHSPPPDTPSPSHLE